MHTHTQEVTINGIGERAGNTSLEEVVMALRTHPNMYTVSTDIRSQLLFRTSKLVSQLVCGDPGLGHAGFAHLLTHSLIHRRACVYRQTRPSSAQMRSHISQECIKMVEVVVIFTQTRVTHVDS